MTNYILGIFAKRLKLVDKKDIKEIASSSVYPLALVLFLVNDLFFHDKSFSFLSGILTLVIIFISIFSLFILFKKISTIPDFEIVSFERSDNLTKLTEGNFVSVSIGGLVVGETYPLYISGLGINDKDTKIIHHSSHVKKIGFVFEEFEYKTQNFIVEYQPIFTDGLTEENLKNPSVFSKVDVKITQVEFDNVSRPLTVNMCNQTYQTELPYILVHVEYSESSVAKSLNS